MRVKDVTILDNNEEDIVAEEATDKYAKYYAKGYVPKVLLTTSNDAHSVCVIIFYVSLRFKNFFFRKWLSQYLLA